MSSTNVPITPESFLLAIRDLELEQLHLEVSRLHNSIFHLERSIIALEEFRDDAECRIAIEENSVTIGRQRERIKMIAAEVERRGFAMPCGERESDLVADRVTNGAVNGESREAATEDSQTNGTRAGEESGSEGAEGVYL